MQRVATVRVQSMYCTARGSAVYSPSQPRNLHARVLDTGTLRSNKVLDIGILTQNMYDCCHLW